jgi:hypothetical protein
LTIYRTILLFNGYQNAEKLGFSFVAIFTSSFDFDPNARNQDNITLSLSNSDDDPLASVTEIINATPIPAALPLFATGLGALGLLGWRRKRKNAAAHVAAGL